jgi:N-acetylglucosamine malate deacetylase 1
VKSKETEIVAIIAAHPDDEVLGCGGTIARYSSQGDQVHTLFLADGVSSREKTSELASEVRLESANRAAEILCTHPPLTLALPDNKLDTVPLLEVVKGIEAFLSVVRPTVIFTHHGGDLNVDHRVAHQATLTAARPLPGNNIQEIYSFETVSSTEWSTPSIGHPFVPNHFVEVTEFIAQKEKALKQYEEEMRPYPHARSHGSIKAIMKWRGASVGVDAAEAFVCERRLVK